MKLKQRILLLIFITASCFIQAQVMNVDSLFKVLRKQEGDSSKVVKLNKIANYFLNLGELNKVDSLNEEIITLSKKINYIKGKGNYFINKARIYETKGDYSKALEYNLEARRIAEKNKFRDILSIALNHTGIIYFVQGEYDKALENYKLAIETIKDLGDTKQLGAFLNNVGNIHYNRHEFDLALEYYTRSLKTRENINDGEGIGNSLNNIGNVYMELKQYDRALECFKKAMIFQEKTGNKFDLAYSYINEGLVYEKLKQIKLAEENLIKGLTLAEELNSPEIMRDATGSISGFYENMKINDKALKYFKEYSQLCDSISNNNIVKEMAQKQLSFEYARKELQLQNEQEKKEIQFRENESRQRIIIAGVTIGLILILIFSVFLYKRFKISEKQNKIIEGKNKEITDSINYAKRIQQAILPPVEIIEKSFSAAFVLYKPKDIVSGDFYWFAETELNKIIAVADCTGHGVPGGFMSMLGYEMLQDIVLKDNITTTSEALKAMDIRITETLNKSSRTFRDGMDMSICAFQKNKGTLQYSGANRPLIHISNGKLTEYDPDKNTIGGDIDGTEKSYKFIEITAKSGDMIYMFTDGYADQFGGPKGKKFKTKQMKELLLEIAHLDPKEQHAILTQRMEKWKGSLEQVDDVCVIGIKV
jgi:serine phosphatase RsbU (regulator of sigma subunit)/Tfp pilus assembly protein PilF